MKHLTDFINEGIFDNNLNSAIKINGVEIYEPDWKLCEQFFKKWRRRYFGKQKTAGTSITFGYLKYNITILYNEEDCVICKNNESDCCVIYVICPETIYMNYKSSELIGKSNYRFPLTDISYPEYTWIGFTYYEDDKDWLELQGCYNLRDKQAALDEIGINKGYLPVTISDKAKTIIQKYIKQSS